jgi:hypothetical protein
MEGNRGNPKPSNHKKDQNLEHCSNDIMLSKMKVVHIEAMAMVYLIAYLKKTKQMEEGRWPKVLFNDILCKKEKAQMQQNIN